MPEQNTTALKIENERLREALQGMLDTCGEHIEDVLSREDTPDCFDAIDEAREVLRTEVEVVRVATLYCPDCNRLSGALRRVEETLRVPAAEYVPAIPDAWKIIDEALKHG